MRGEIIFKHKMTPGKLSDKNQFLGIESVNRRGNLLPAVVRSMLAMKD